MVARLMVSVFALPSGAPVSCLTAKVSLAARCAFMEADSCALLSNVIDLSAKTTAVLFDSFIFFHRFISRVFDMRAR